MRPSGLLADLLLASSEQASGAVAASLTAVEGQAVLAQLSVQDGVLALQGKALKSSWRLSGVLALMGDWPPLEQLQSVAMRAELDWAPNFAVLHAMTSLVELRLSLSRHPIPSLPQSLRSLRLDLPGDLTLEHPNLVTLHLYGAAHASLGDLGLPLLTELRVEQCRALQSVEALPERLERLSLVDLPELRSLPALPANLRVQTVRCPMLHLS